MSLPSGSLPAPLEEIMADFQESVGREKIELLLYYAENMAPLPQNLQGNHQKMEQVHECMTPVFVHAELDQGRMAFFFDVPEESPTVRGYAAILGQGLQGATPDQILALPSEFFLTMGLQDILSPQRINGFGAILAHMKRLALKASQPASD
jgi:cysteine desulfuration protein SufE